MSLSFIPPSCSRECTVCSAAGFSHVIRCCVFRASCNMHREKKKGSVMQSKDSVVWSKVELLQAAGQILYLWQPSINMWREVSRPLSSLGCWYLFVLGGHRKNRQYLSAPRRWQLSKMLISWTRVWRTDLWRAEFVPECLHADSAWTFVWMNKAPTRWCFLRCSRLR